MTGKIIGSNGNVLFEFEEGQNIEVLLSGLIQRAKFGERFDNDVLANDWVNQLLGSLIDAYPEFLKTEDEEAFHSGAPELFLEAGMTQKDWDLQDFFYDITCHLKTSISLLNRVEWKNMSKPARHEFLRSVIFPQPISDARLQDMIEEIDHTLFEANSAYNPNYGKTD